MSYQRFYRVINGGLKKKASNEQLVKLANLIGMRKKAQSSWIDNIFSGINRLFSNEEKPQQPASGPQLYYQDYWAPGASQASPYIRSLNKNYSDRLKKELDRVQAASPGVYENPSADERRSSAAEYFERIGKPAEEFVFPEYVGLPVDKWVLRQRRRREAGEKTDRILGPNATQQERRAGRRYLMERGAQNQDRGVRGTLHKNQDTAVQTPAMFKDPKIRKAFELEGYRQAENKRKPSYSQQLAGNMPS